MHSIVLNNLFSDHLINKNTFLIAEDFFRGQKCPKDNTRVTAGIWFALLIGKQVMQVERCRAAVDCGAAVCRQTRTREPLNPQFFIWILKTRYRHD